MHADAADDDGGRDDTDDQDLADGAENHVLRQQLAVVIARHEQRARRVVERVERLQPAKADHFARDLIELEAGFLHQLAFEILHGDVVGTADAAQVGQHVLGHVHPRGEDVDGQMAGEFIADVTHPAVDQRLQERDGVAPDDRLQRQHSLGAEQRIERATVRSMFRWIQVQWRSSARKCQLGHHVLHRGDVRVALLQRRDDVVVFHQGPEAVPRLAVGDGAALPQVAIDVVGTVEGFRSQRIEILWAL